MVTHSFIGVDIAKKKFDASILVNNKPKHGVFDNNLSGFKKFLSWVCKQVPRAWICMEATGHYSEALADFMHHQGFRVSVINPMQIKNFAKVMLKRNKNDILDANLIRAYSAMMKPAVFQPRPLKQKEIRALIQLLDTLKEQSTQLKNKLDATQHPVARKETQKIIQALENHMGKLTSKIKGIISKTDSFKKLVALLVTVKGIGALSAYRLLALLPDIRLFKSAKQLAAFIGVTPRQCESGQWKGKTRLSKFGNARLRKVLYMPALVAKRSNPHFKAFVKRLENKGLTPKAIIGAIMRKLTHIIFGILKHQQPFKSELVST